MARTTRNVGLVRALMGDHAGAVEMFKVALKKYRGHYGDQHFLVAECLIDLAESMEKLEELDDAERYYREAIDLQKMLNEPDAPEVSVLLHNFGAFLQQQKRYEEALSPFKEALGMRMRAQDPEHRATAVSEYGVMRTLTRMGRFAEAEEIAPGCFDRFVQAYVADHARTQKVMERIAELYEEWNAAEPGAGHDAKAAEWRERLEAATSQPAE